MTARRPDVACVGAPFLDLIFRGLAAIPAPGEEQLARELVVVPGAMANIAYALNRLGLDAVVCAHVGDDPAGRLLQELLAEAGVRWVGRPTHSTPVTVSLPAAGDRAFVTAAPEPTVDAETLAELAPPVVVVDLPSVAMLPDLPEPPDVYAVMGDPEVQTLDGRIPPTMRGLRALLLNDREARALTRAPDAETAAATLAGHGTTVIVTCGPVGAVAVEPGGRVAKASAPRVEVEDTTGAGDLFTAAYIWADLSGRTIEERLDLAVRYASTSLAAAPVRGQKGLALERFLEEV